MWSNPFHLGTDYLVRGFYNKSCALLSPCQQYLLLAQTCCNRIEYSFENLSFWKTGPKIPVTPQKWFIGFYPHMKLTGTSIRLLEVSVLLLSFVIALKNDKDKVSRCEDWKWQSLEHEWFYYLKVLAHFRSGYLVDFLHVQYTDLHVLRKWK